MTDDPALEKRDPFADSNDSPDAPSSTARRRRPSLPRRYTIILAATAVVLAIGSIAVQKWRLDRAHSLLALVLEIRELPNTVKDIACKDWSSTDILVRCTFALQPADLPKLLTGRQFAEASICREQRSPGCDERHGVTTHHFCCGPEMGDEYPVAAIYRAVPSNAPYGGSLTLVTDQARRRAMVDLYVE